MVQIIDNRVSEQIPQPLKMDKNNNTIADANSSIGSTVSCALTRANYEKRVVIGLPNAVKELSNQSEDTIFCIMAPTEAGDSATHMMSTLLEAFCYENDIYIIKVDSSKKLSRLLGSSQLISCALILRPWIEEHQTEQLTVAEEALIDHCEEFWDVPKQPTITLPD